MDNERKDTPETNQDSVEEVTAEAPKFQDPNQGRLKRSIIFILIFLAVSIIMGAFLWIAGEKFTPQQRACTQEAKECPDGSFVSRTDPNCEFSNCPSLTNTPKTSKNDDLKTYTSEKFGFSFKYPSNWRLNEQESTVILEPGVGTGREFPPSGGIEVIERSKYSSPQEYALTFDKDLIFKQFKLDDTEGVETLLPGVGDGYKDIFILRGKYIYQIGFSLGYDDSVRDTLKNSYDQILQTFKFTEEECSDKKVYKSLEEALKSSNQASVCYIDLSGKNLDKLPEEIFGFSNLESLSLNFNRLTTLPLNLKLLKKLKTLDLTGNSLTQGDVEELRSVLPTTNIIFLGTMNLPQ